MPTREAGAQSPNREAALAALRGLQPLSAVAVQLQVLSEEDLGIAEVAEMIKADAALSADVLRLANSPLFGLRQLPSGVLQAVAMLGVSRVMTVVTTAALRNFASGARGTAALQRCWRHNIACGFICEDLARAVNLDVDLAYTAGLLHDLGRTGMLAVWAQRYGRLLDEASPDPAGLLTAEREEFGITHTDAGAFLLQNWRLPEVLVDVARVHHECPAPDVRNYGGMVHCACRLADQLGFVVTGKAGVENLPLDVPQPWSSLVAGMPERLGLGVAERINALESYFLS